VGWVLSGTASHVSSASISGWQLIMCIEWPEGSLQSFVVIFVAGLAQKQARELAQLANIVCCRAARSTG